jgi:hypothetical protein
LGLPVTMPEVDMALCSEFAGLFGALDPSLGRPAEFGSAGRSVPAPAA